jgi:hypothetical protein
MKLSLILVADYANVTQEGKLNVMGIFREINAYNFPARHPSMHLVLSLRAELGEYGVDRNLIVKLLDADGNEIMNLSGQLSVPKGGGGIVPEVNAILELKDVIFQKPGPYQFVVLVDKDYKGDLTISVNKVESPEAVTGKMP